MLRYLSVLLGLALAVGAFAAHDNVLMYSDTYWGMNPPKTAIQGLGWTFTGFENGNQGGFISALNGGTDWDIVVVDNWMYSCSGLGAPVATYLSSHDEVAMWFDSYNSGNMGAVAPGFEAQIGSAISGSAMGAVYVWDDAHPIFEGVTPDWENPGVITAGYKLNWVTRAGVPLLGFVADETAWEAGIVMGNDGRTLLGGYNPTYDSDEAVDIWTNIWEWLDDPAFKPGAFNLLTPEDGAIIDVFTGRGDEPEFVAKGVSSETYGAVTLYNKTSDPVDVDVEFTWEESVNAEDYQLLVDDDYTMNTPLVDESGITETTYTYTFSVDETITYYWRVIASNENGDTQCNEDFDFEFNYNNTNIAPASLGAVKAAFH